MWRMGYALVFMTLYIISQTAVESKTFLCSQCSSQTTKTCEEKPPVATDCAESASQKACNVIRVYDINKKQVEFKRGCSMIGKEKPSEGCLQQQNNFTVCYILCFEHGCNSSASVYHLCTYGIMFIMAAHVLRSYMFGRVVC